MDTGRFRRIESIFLAVSELPPEERAGYLRAECAGDASLQAEVEAMLAHDGGMLLDTPKALRGGLESVLEAAESAGSGAGVPSRIGRYDVVRRIALGGMGAIYEAEQAHPQRRVALKVVRPDALSQEMLGRFRHETEILGRLQHPGIAQIFEAGTFDLGGGEQPFFAMEYVDGRPILEFARENDLTTKQRHALVAEVCDAVHHAHQQGVIHRDLKSDNVLVDGDGKPKILDFGVGRLVDADATGRTSWTMAGQLVGTLAYMSPEQIRGSPGDADTRSDVYALGVILYELLAGRLPFDLSHVSLAEAGRIICEEDPPRLDDRTGPSHGDVEAILRKALEKEKARRYSTAGDLADDIRRFLADLPIEARPATTWYQLRKFARRHRVAFVGAAATLLALAVGFVSTAVQAVRATRLATVAAANEVAAQRTAYRANIAAASSALALGDTLAARRHLDAAPQGLRKWEWRHLSARLDGTEAVYRADSGTEVAAGRDARLAFGADGTPFFLHAADEGLEVVDVVRGKPVARIPLEDPPVAAALSPDGARVAALDGDSRLRVWDVAGGGLQTDARLVLEPPPVDLLFSENGALLAAADAHEVVFVDAATGLARARHRIDAPDEYRGATFTPDGGHLLIATRLELRSVDTRTGETGRRRPTSNGADVVAVSSDESRVAVGTDQHTHVVRIHDGASLAPLGRVGGHPFRAFCASFSPDGRFLATASPERVVIHDAASFRMRKSLVLPDLLPVAVRWSPDGARLLVAEAAREVRLIRWDTPPYLELRGHQSFVYVAAWSPDGTMVASAGWDRTVRLWDAASGRPLARLPIPLEWVSYIGFDEEGSRLLAGTGGEFFAWDVATGRRVEFPVAESRDLSASHLIPSAARGGSKLVQWASGGQNHATSPAHTLLVRDNHVIDLATGADRAVFPDAARRIRAVAASFDDRRIATGAWDGRIHVWDVASGRRLATLEGTRASSILRDASAAEVYSVEFSPDGARLISGGDDARIVLWDLESGEEVATLQPHESYVHVVAFSPDGTRILSGSGDATLRIWDSRPWNERNRAVRDAEARRARIRPRVERLLDALKDPALVAGRLRAESSLDDENRRAALRALLALATEPR